MVDFSKLRESRLDKLTKALNEDKSSFKPDDDSRIWTPSVDKAGNGMVVVRFLPTAAMDGDNKPWVKKYNHGFQGSKGWLIYDCPTTIGKPCPVCEDNTLLWNADTQESKNIARSRKRKLRIFSNIVIINDPKNPENNGKVFIFNYGKSIFDKIELALVPKFEGETPIDPFHVLDGANFRIKITTIDGYRNYDLSSFDPPSPLFDGDEEKIMKAYNSQYSLQEVIDSSLFSSYDEIKKRFDFVVGKEEVSVGYSDNPPPIQDDSYRGSLEENDDELNYFKNLSGSNDDDVPF